MFEFIKAALPYFLIGLSIAIFFAAYSKKHKEKSAEGEENPVDLSSMGILFGAAIGIAIGTVIESIGAGLGAGIGMLFGSIIEYLSAVKK